MRRSLRYHIKSTFIDEIFHSCKQIESCLSKRLAETEKIEYETVSLPFK